MRTPLSTFRVLLFSSLLMLSGALHAEHLPGGSITYECMGNNTYTITLTLLRECSGEAMVPQDLRFNNDCGVSFRLDGLVHQEVADVSPLCAAQSGSSNCNGGTLFGVQAYTYRQTLYLSPCNAWTIAWSTCCRQSSINVQANPGLYIEARLNNTNNLCTNSPLFHERGIPVVCAGQPVTYDPGVSEADGDSLAYRFIEARFGTPDPFAVIYTFPYYGLEPFTGMLIDPATGIITFNPTTQGYVVTVVQVDEYDSTGTWTGSVMRDFPFLVRACSSPVPSASTGLITGVSGAGQQLDGRSVKICDNGTFCMDLSFSPTSGQGLSISSNIAQVLPGATLTTTGSAPVAVQICWDATGALPTRADFTIVATNDVCPVPGSQWYHYSLLVEASPDSIANSTALACPQTDPFSLVDSLSSYPSHAGTWTDPSGTAHPALFSPGTDPEGDYTFTMESFPGCRTSTVVSLQYLAPDDTLCSLVSVPELFHSPLALYPNPGPGLFHIRSIEAFGTGPFIAHVQDLLGRTLATVPLHASTGDAPLNLPSSLANGNYLLRLENASGFTAAKRFTLQR